MKTADSDWRHQSARDLYAHVLQTANRFLRNARMFEISILQDHNPSYAELAEIMRKVGSLIYDIISDIDPLLAQKAFDYVRFMTDMSIAITQDDQGSLDRLVAELDKMSFL